MEFTEDKRIVHTEDENFGKVFLLSEKICNFVLK